MNTSNVCPACGKTLTSDAVQGLCPACLLKAGIPTSAVSAPTAPTASRRPFVPPPPAELAPHFPQLEVLELIGQGGMGAVYKARQPSLDRFVALKILAPQLSGEPGFAGRFTREARALARLTHANIVTVHDFGQAGGFHFLVMEFVDGMNLRQLLAAQKLPPHEAIAIVPVICGALQFAHDRGIVHRDIKPENILIDKTGAVKIADFGLAKIAGTPESDAALTGAGDILGTPHYRAPEQVEHPRDVDHRADIYSRGVVFYQMLTGELPLGRFAAPSRKVEVDVRLDEIVLRALEKEPALRYQKASGLKTDVEHVAATPAGNAPGGAERGPLHTLADRLGLDLGAPPPRRDDPSSESNASADGKLLVVPRTHSRLPLRCVKTNESVSAGDVARQKVEWVPPIIYWSLLLTPIAFFILYYLFRQQIEVQLPLSTRGRACVRRHRWSAAGLALAGVALAVAGGTQHILAALLFGLALLLAATIYAVLVSPVLRLVQVKNGDLWLAGASRALLASLPPYRAR